MLLLDTSVILPCLRRATRAAHTDFLLRVSDEEAPAISVITRFEVIAGTPPEFQSVNARFLDAFPVVNLDQKIADRAGQLSDEWARKGHLLAPNDVLIGASAIALRFTLATLNRRHFPYLKELDSQTIEYRGTKGRQVKETIYLCA